MELENWKTTITALITAFFGFVIASPELFAEFPLLIAVAKYGAAGGLILFGIVSADKNPTAIPDDPNDDNPNRFTR